MRVRNELKKNSTIITAIGDISFDKDGIAEVADDFASQLIQLKHYEAVDMPVKGSDEPNESYDSIENEQVEADTSVELTEENLSTKNVPQLKKIAKDAGIDLGGANKKDEIISIILGSNQ